MILTEDLPVPVIVKYKSVGKKKNILRKLQKKFLSRLFFLYMKKDQRNIKFCYKLNIKKQRFDKIIKNTIKTFCFLIFANLI